MDGASWRSAAASLRSGQPAPGETGCSTPSAAACRCWPSLPHIPREEIGTSYFQETHPQELFPRVQRLRRAGQHSRSSCRACWRSPMRTALARRRRGRGRGCPARSSCTRRPARAAAGPSAPPRSAIIPGRGVRSAAAAAHAERRQQRHDLGGRGLRGGAHDEVVALAGPRAAGPGRACPGAARSSWSTTTPTTSGMTGPAGLQLGLPGPMEHCDAPAHAGHGPSRTGRFNPPEGTPVIQVDVRRREHRPAGSPVDIPPGRDRPGHDSPPLAPRLDLKTDSAHLDRMTSPLPGGPGTSLDSLAREGHQRARRCHPQFRRGHDQRGWPARDAVFPGRRSAR